LIVPLPALDVDPPPVPVAALQADSKAEPDPSSTPAVPAFFKKSRRLVCAVDAPAGEASGGESFLRLKTTSSHRSVA
jgi:hypothetical protein